MQNSSIRYKILLLIKQTHGYFRHAPKSEKYGLVLQIKNLEYELYCIVTEILVTRSDRRKSLLHRLNVRHELLRAMFALYRELGFFHFQDGRNCKDTDPKTGDHRGTVVDSMVDEIGRMIGAWIAAERDETARRIAARKASAAADGLDADDPAGQ